ncbi:MAG: DUF4129 domain-containing protein [Candidatus Geothermarchaeales archaeon]
MALLGGERSKPIAFVLLLVAVFAMANLAFNLENMVLGPELLPEIGEPSGYDGDEAIFQPPVQIIRTFFQYLLVVLLAALIIALAYLYQKGKSRELLIEMAGFILALIFILTFFVLWMLLSDFPLYTPGGVAPDPSGLPGDSTPPLPGSAVPTGLGIIGIAFLLILLAFVISSRLVRREEMGAPLDVRKRAIDRLEETIYRLYLGEEIRSAILRCYADMTRLFERWGLRYGAYVTARELEMLAVKRLGLSSRSAVRLRELFEEARYSSHQLSDEYKETAVQCLKSVKTELEAHFVAS